MANNFESRKKQMDGIYHNVFLLIGGILLLLFGGVKTFSTLSSMGEYTPLFSDPNYGSMMMAAVALDVVTGISELAAGILALVFRKNGEMAKITFAVSIVAVIAGFITALVVIFTSDTRTAYSGGRMPIDLVASLFVLLGAYKLMWMNKHKDKLAETQPDLAAK